MSRAIDPRPRPSDDPTPYLSHPDALYEIVDGEVVEKPEMGAAAYLIAMNLFEELRAYLRSNPIGRPTFEAFFVLDPARNLRRRPDVAFVSFERWPAGVKAPGEGDFEVVPELAIEVISPGDEYLKVFGKLREYFDYGVRQVWHVLPGQFQVHVYRSVKDSRVLTGEDELDGGILLPGFRLPVGPLFNLDWD
jgi:Uma2 family endonuclease